jgi:NADH-quinone oxidoreductase subunit N
MGSFSSGILLYGIILLFGVMGTLDFVEVSYLMLDMLYLNVDLFYIIYILSFILVGLLFKLGIAPFHWWVPEVYEGAPLVVTLFFIVVPKVSLVFLLVKLYNYIFINFIEIFSAFFLICTIASLILGFFFTLYQKKIVKFLAYSTIFNGGFFMACFANGTYLSLVSLLYFFIPYILLLLGVFFFLICFRKANNVKINLL